MYTVITNDNKVPKELDGFVTEIWTLEQFVKKCNDQTDGFSVDEGLWYHVTELTEDIYNQLKFYVDDGAVDIMYYCYKTDVLPDFEIDKLNLCTDPDEPTAEEPEPEPDPVSEPDPEPIKEPEPVAPKCDGSNHGIGVGNSNKWFNSKQEAINYYDGIQKTWGDKWENFEIDSATYDKNCPYGYEVWTCPFCGKWTINFYYR